MKKFSIYLLSFTMILFAACNGDGNKGKDDKDKKGDNKEEMKGFVEYDLSPHGYKLIMMIPDENTGLPKAEVTGWGAIDLTVGQNYGVRIEMGEGDMELMKKDLKEDLVYQADIIEEKPNYLFYKKVIPGADLDAEYHFFYKKEFDNGEIYEVKNLKSEVYSEKAVKKMLKSAKTLQREKAEESSEKEEA